MNTKGVTMVRIYLTEGQGQIQQVLDYLHNDSGVHGVTEIRATAGFGDSGKMHEARLIDLALDLPVVLEFFDEPSKAEEVIGHLKDMLKSGHIVHWPAHWSER